MLVINVKAAKNYICFRLILILILFGLNGNNFCLLQKQLITSGCTITQAYADTENHIFLITKLSDHCIEI